MQDTYIKLDGMRFNFSNIVAYDYQGKSSILIHTIGGFDDNEETPYFVVDLKTEENRNAALEKLDSIFKPIDLD